MEPFFHSERRVFRDRDEAGRELGAWFRRQRPKGDLLVLGLPRGGVPVAYEVAAALVAPLDVFLVRKLGAPFNPEFAVGAIAAGDVIVYNEEAVAGLGLDSNDLKPIIARERGELARRERAYRAGKPPLALEKKTVILVDDGIATGSTMRAAVAAAKAMHAERVIVAAPTASRQAVEELEQSADLVAVLAVPEPYDAVGKWYEYFPQLDDSEVVELLSLHEQQRARQPAKQLHD
jgi:predicted phosphoribosyltransferase